MAITPRPSRRPVTRIARLLAAVIGLVAASALVLPSAAPAATPKASADTLAAAVSAVEQSGVDGLAWHVDDAANRVVVTADSSVSAADLATIKQAAHGSAAAIRIERTHGVFRPLLDAGDAIYGNRYRCSLGFNVSIGSTYYFLTAGHCGKSEKNWYTSGAANRQLIGPTLGYSFPGDDYALVRYDNASLAHSGGYTVSDAYVGERVTRDGSTTGVHTGTVTALNVSVRYQGGGTVRGMIQTNVCAEGGDSGGPLYDGSKALGLTSGGSGDCKRGGTTFFQPLREAVDRYGVTVY